MTVVSEMLGVPTPGFEWVYPPRTRCWRLLCRGVSAGFFSAFFCSALEQRELALLALVGCVTRYPAVCQPCHH